MKLKRIIYLILWILVSFVGYQAIHKSYTVINDYFKPSLTVKLINHPYSLGNPAFSAVSDKYKFIEAQPEDKEYDIVLANVHGEEDIKKTNPKAIRLFYSAEAYLPNIEDYDLVLAFDRIDDPKYIRYPYYFTDPGTVNPSRFSRAKQERCNPKKKNFGCFLVSNGCSKLLGYNGKIAEGIDKRDSLFKKLSEYKWIASGGKHLNNIGGPLPGSKTKEWFGNCKFVISYENQLHNGYITEKVFKSYLAGAIPIYWGDPTGVSDINKEAIIYTEDFPSENELIEYIKKVDNDDELYCKIWNQPLVIDPQINDKLTKKKVRDKMLELIKTKLNK